jgi:hypothetical protein
MPNFSEKIKHFKEFVTKDRIFMPILIVLVGTASFGLGRLSAYEKGQDRPIEIIGPEATVPKNETAAAANAVVPQKQGNTASQQDGKVVGSKNGTKYHFPWCSGAQRIAEANKVWFDSIEAAKAAGYTPAANCKGLQ